MNALTIELLLALETLHTATACNHAAWCGCAPYCVPEARNRALITKARAMWKADVDVRIELLNLLDIIAVRFESPRPIGGPDDAMLIAEIAAALKRARGQS